MNAQNARGFTLVESLVAIAIITMAIAGPLWAAGQSLRAAETAQDQLIASNLAQEAVEYVRAVRDDDYLSAYKADKTSGGNVSADAWTAFLSDVSGCTTAGGGCVMNLQDWDRPYPSSTGGQPLLSCATNASVCASPLVLSTTRGHGHIATGEYNRRNGAPTPFTRNITVDSVGRSTAPVEQVVATVTWTAHGATYQTSITDDLTPWQ